ncbi:hypothetical protein BH10PSE17_BH10PSE17_12490 [soil metagenome]
MQPSERRHYAFSDFRLDARTRRFTRANGEAIALTPKAFDLLLHLVQHSGETVSKDALMLALWPGRVVEENNLTQTISAVRRALGADGPGFIVTVPGRGYRFVVEIADDSADEAVPIDTSAPIDAAPEVAREAIAVATVPAARKRSFILVAAAAACVVIVAALIGWIAHDRGTRTGGPITIAVLPFKPLLAGERDEVLEIGIADTLITKLSSSNRLVVRSINSVRRYTALDQDPLAAAAQLGVGAVLEGQIYRSGNQVRLTARLLSVPDGKALWTGTFDDRFTDVFTVQDTIAAKVASALALKLAPDEQVAMTARSTADPKAYEVYLAGRYHLGKVVEPEIRQSIVLFQQAIAIDPNYALAYAGMAEAYRRLPITSDSDPSESFPQAKVAAAKALELDASLADAHAVLGWISMWYDWNWVASERSFRRAIALNPHLVEAHIGLGTLMSNQRRDVEAIEEGRLAREIEPSSPLVPSLAATFSIWSGGLPEGRRLADKALEIAPDFWIAQLYLGQIAVGEQHFDQAVTEFEKARVTSNGGAQALSLLGYALARQGRTAEARAVLAQLTARAARQYVPASAIATIYAGLGENDPMFVWLDKAREQRDVRMAFLKADARWDPWRADPRFRAIATDVGLN